MNNIYIQLELGNSIKAGESDRLLVAHEFSVIKNSELPNKYVLTGRNWNIMFKHSDVFMWPLKRAKRKLLKRIEILTNRTPEIV